MGRTYEAKGCKRRISYDVNFAGADILGYLMKAVDEHSKRLEEDDNKMGWIRPPCTRFSMSASDCKRSIKKLSELTDEQYENIWGACKDLFEPSSTVKDLKSTCQEWIDFLKKCKKGYKVD